MLCGFPKFLTNDQYALLSFDNHSRQPSTERFSVSKIADSLKLMERLESRELVHPGELDHALETRARMHRAGAPYSPVYPTTGRLFPGTYYLNGIDSEWKRTYSRVPLDAKMTHRSGNGEVTPLAPPIVHRLAERDALSQPVTGKLAVLQSTSSDKLTEARRRIACVITGTAAGLPGGEAAFHEDNLKRLIEGKNCIEPISGSVKMAMLEKNIVQLKKHPDGKTEKIKVDSESKVIKLAAQLKDSFCLTTSYGVPAGLAETMDIAAQVAVAAGMEALKSAGLVSGKSNDPKEWLLPEKYRDSTGVVYASSFPAMDAAVGEVMRFLQSKTVGAAPTMRLISALRSRMIRSSPDRELSDDDEAAFARLLTRSQENDGSLSDSSHSTENKEYVFDRKFLFRVLVLGNAQLAQLAGCRGPNTQTNAACAGTTQVSLSREVI